MNDAATGRFIPGTHWRPERPWWDRAWLVEAYVTEQRSAPDIAAQGGCLTTNITYWLQKHGIPTRTMAEVRAIKHWGLVGAANPMYGRTGAQNPRWRGGLSPARQAIYASAEWKAVARQVRRRDKSCRMCPSRERGEIHHIIPFSAAPLLAVDLGNLILLCEKCHKRVTGKERRYARRLLALIGEKGVIPVWRRGLTTKIPA